MSTQRKNRQPGANAERARKEQGDWLTSNLGDESTIKKSKQLLLRNRAIPLHRQQRALADYLFDTERDP